LEQQLILDRYRPLADLGSGGHASVTLAYDTRMGRRVAIKRLPLPVDALGRPRKVGLAEARTAALLNHPAIVTVYEWDTDPDEAFLIMEFVEGVSLADLLASMRRLDQDEAAAVLGPVLAALGFAHANGVLHLDVKPENVLVTRDGDVKVADFGISALTNARGTAEVAEGTLGYMPPEQLRCEALDARTDVWALGALAYEVLTGANPFEASTIEGALFRAQLAEIAAPSEETGSVPPTVDDVVFAALAPEPAERYADASAFAAALLPRLGDAEAGRDAVARTVREMTADDVVAEQEAYGRLGLWDRLGRVSPWATRAFAALVCGWMAYASLTPWAFGPAATLVAAALVALAGAFAPALGLALAFLALPLAAVRVGTWAGVAFVTWAALLWAALGRRGRADGLLAAAAPAFGVLRVGPALPLLLGFTFDPLPAAAAAALGSLALMAFAGMSGAAAPLLTVRPEVLLDPWTALEVSGRLAAFAAPGPWIAALAWGGAAAATSLFCRRGTRMGAGLGVALGAAVILGGYALWSLTGPRLVWPSTTVLQQLAASLILMTLVIALGPPVRGEGDDEQPPTGKAG
jgi:hypothetical protein